MASAHAGDAPTDPVALFDRHRERLRRTVRLRLDRRLVGLVDSSGVLRMAREQVASGGDAAIPAGVDPFLGLRRVVGEVLARLHRQRLGPDVREDISLYRGSLPPATTV